MTSSRNLSGKGVVRPANKFVQPTTPTITNQSKKPTAKSTVPDSVSGVKWVIVQMTPLGEREKNLNLITRSVCRLLGKQVEVFIPAVSEKVRDESQTLFYMDGYVFVKFHPELHYLKLQETMYFSAVLVQNSLVNGKMKRTFSLIDDRDIAPMRKGVQNLKLGEFTEGDVVKVMKGNYKNLRAEVNFVHPDNQTVQVYVNLVSKKILMDFPSSYLKLIPTAP